MKHYKVVAAVIAYDGKILCVQKGDNPYHYLRFKFEFPGGKVEQGERDEEALEREIREELRLDIRVESKIAVVNHQYPDFMVTMTAFKCSAFTKEFVLTEHIAAIWLSRWELNSLVWVEADRPIVDRLVSSA